jgi:hypothetical protein
MSYSYEGPIVETWVKREFRQEHFEQSDTPEYIEGLRTLWMRLRLSYWMHRAEFMWFHRNFEAVKPLCDSLDLYVLTHDNSGPYIVTEIMWPKAKFIAELDTCSECHFLREGIRECERAMKVMQAAVSTSEGGLSR